MRITNAALLSLLLLARSTSAYTRDEHNAIEECCAGGCQDACDWVEDNGGFNPPAVVSSCVNPPCPTRERPTRSRVLMRHGEMAEAMCCIGNGGGGGDPHIKTWNGEYFDYHGQCDLILVDAPSFGEGLGLQMHIRTKTRYDYSFIESAALKIGDTDVLEVASWGEHFLNGVDSAILVKKHVAAFPIDYLRLDEKSVQITVDLGDNQKVIFKTFKDWVSVSLENATAKDFKTSRGLMGHFFTGTKFARDGHTEMTDDNAFGQEWQVRPEEAGLFQVSDREPQAPHQQCILPVATTVVNARRLGEGDVTKEQAQKACSKHADPTAREMCVFDVMATGDLDMAEAGGF